MSEKRNMSRKRNMSEKRNMSRKRSEISPETRFYKIMVICINMRKRP